ncbi:MAG: sugar ABC transporter permease [Acidimicrobiales bacterium]
MVRANPINFVQGIPFNNFWLMMILIWIQTGFAMVILSAAIKAVPEDFIEAAKIDGATDGQIFWRITVPQILPTIGVVATTIMVNVMKVFDIVKVTTNGQFDTQVLANAMYNEAFQFGNRGVGAALAMVLFLGILPVMVFNIYNLTKEDRHGCSRDDRRCYEHGREDLHRPESGAHVGHGHPVAPPHVRALRQLTRPRDAQRNSGWWTLASDGEAHDSRSTTTTRCSVRAR